MDTKCTVLICSCDKYQDILPPFFTLFKKYWPDCPYDIALSTESINYQDKNLKILNLHPSSPNCSWTERISEALKDINSSQILLLCDDFFLYNKVNTAKVRQIVQWLQEDRSIAAFTLWPLLYGAGSSPYDSFASRSKKAKYKIAVIAGLWNKRWLQKYLKGAQETAWQFEPNANQRSHKMLRPGKFYAMLDSQDTIFPYDFTKIGLFSGQWLPDTKKVFQANRIKIDFQKRGFFDNTYRATMRSNQEVFSVDSKILPSRYFKYKNSFVFPKKQIPSNDGKIHQEYNFHYGLNCFRWCISDIAGCSISNLKIEVVYDDDTISEVDYNLIVGPFLKINDRYVFNHYAPHMIIPTIPDKPFHKVTIAAKITMPASKPDLKKAYQHDIPITKYTNLSPAYAQNCLEYSLSSDCSINHLMQSQVQFMQKTKLLATKTEQILPGGYFSYTYILPPPTTTIIWTPSANLTYTGFYITDLNITLSSPSITKKFQSNDLVAHCSFPQYHAGAICCPVPLSITLDTAGYSSIQISGKMSKPIPAQFLYNNQDKRTIYDIIKKIRRKLCKKSK